MVVPKWSQQRAEVPWWKLPGYSKILTFHLGLSSRLGLTEWPVAT